VTFTTFWNTPMRRYVCVALLVMACCLPLAARQGQQVRGQVVNRDGVPQQCQVDFYLGADLAYRLKSNGQGYFFINTPRGGAYRVVVLQGNRQSEFKRVTIDAYGLHPATLVVPW
jgi:hypothetical protein